ncbi:AsmA family protein [Thiohalophilus sp.]|uniref:DUF748 domain-containing protein n=1 Tax=Thiohalophilus sp. TaxID=3028392 RepID=UPI002ACDD226|nr:AsmA family protein [Thiohalophilus sp.]MDZ7661118.1 AsmA family protein [Thiohalophilus sp.]MDZ7803229.1 AsmA family protein [Thiohalophilus sp.]
MKKVILSLFALVVIAIAAAVFYVLTNLDAIVKDTIEKYGSEATQTAIRVDKVKIKLTEGDGAVYGLTVANPEGFELAHAISLGETAMGIDFKSIREEPYVINHITVRGPRVFFEVNANTKANLNELKKNLVMSQPAAKESSETEKSAAKQPRLIIRRITFEQGGIAAKVTPLNKDYELNLPNINMTDLGGSQGATPGELTREILQRLIDVTIDEIRKKGIDAELDKLKSEAREKVEEEKARLKDEADSKIDEEKKKAEDKLRRLLN